MRWLRLVGSFKLYVSFAEYSLFYRALLQKRPIIVRSLLIVATPYGYWVMSHECAVSSNESWMCRNVHDEPHMDDDVVCQICRACLRIYRVLLWIYSTLLRIRHFYTLSSIWMTMWCVKYVGLVCRYIGFFYGYIALLRITLLRRRHFYTWSSIWMTMWCVKYTWFAPRMFGMCHDSFSICAVTHYPYVHHIWMTMWCVKYRCIAPRMFRLCHDSLSMCAMTHFPYVPWLVFHDCCTHFPARLNVVVGCTMWVTAHMCKNKCGRGMYYSTSSDPRLTWWSWDVLCAIDI